VHSRGRLAIFSLALLTLLVGLAAGCGGGGGGGSEQQGGGGNGGAEQQGGGNGGGNAPETKIALGNIVFINAEKQTFTLRPNAQGDDQPEPVRYRMTPKAQIALEGEEATLEDIEKGQQAQVEYVVRNGSNRAKSVELFEGESGGGDSGGGESTN
jgi:hypothetical protein